MHTSEAQLGNKVDEKRFTRYRQWQDIAVGSDTWVISPLSEESAVDNKYSPETRQFVIIITATDYSSLVSDGITLSVKVKNTYFYVVLSLLELDDSKINEVGFTYQIPHLIITIHQVGADKGGTQQQAKCHNHHHQPTKTKTKISTSFLRKRSFPALKALWSALVDCAASLRRADTPCLSGWRLA
ncbi:unnamed protein product [Ceratitis capitata]|uniref:(Mediterranean fruit fly) hypothetical protein n=1 Tax=Ceratitis capitata TaxID=7213 RepID=A0A811UNE0_CERCA|nr:unnamed protein product [Ceratitis capitata]